MPIDQRILGSGGLVVGAIGYGAMGFGRPYGQSADQVTDAAADALIGRAIELGVTMIDTADIYAGSEGFIGKAIAGRRDQVVIATKIGIVRALSGRPAAGAQRPTGVRPNEGRALPYPARYRPCRPVLPLGRGMLTGAITSRDDLPENGYRRRMPRFAPDAFDANLNAVEVVREIARDHDAAPGQVAIAWLLAKAPDVVPIPGTLHVSRLEENTAAAGLTLASAEIARLDALPVTGQREIELGYNWSYGVTPPLSR